MEFYTNLEELVQHMKKEECDRIAYRFVRDGIQKKVTYQKLVRKIEEISVWIHQNIGERKVIALFGKTSYEWMAVYLGVLTSNNIVATLDAKLMQEQKEAILNEMEATIVFQDNLTQEQQQSIFEKCSRVEKIINMLDFVQEEKEVSMPIQYVQNSDDIAQYMFTSGSTGKSKVAMFSYRNIASIIKLQNNQFIKAHDTVLSVLPIHHCFELCTQLSELYYGATICINDDMETLIDSMKYYEPTLMNLVPAQVEEILRHFKQWARSHQINSEANSMTEEQKELFYESFGKRLCRIFSGGAPVSTNLASELQFYGVHVINGYGMTEMCGYICINQKLIEKKDSVGIPFRDDISIKIAEDGEVLIKGPNQMRGYRKMKREACFTEDGYIKTGDLGHKDEDGYLYILGRKKNIILLSNGENVYPEELEMLLENMEGIRQSAVFEWENQIATLLYTDKNISQQEIKAEIHELNRRLAPYKRITRIYFQENPFPKTGTGKVDKKQLINEFKAVNKTEYVPIKTEEEKIVAECFREVLRCQKSIGALDNFFALGGNSLLALTVAANLEINPQILYENPVIQDLAEVIGRAKSEVIEDESFVNELIRKTKYSVNKGKVKNIFLTGATGFLGAHILNKLVKRKGIKVICLVRSKAKMLKIYQHYFRKELPSKVELVVGDVGKDMLGIRKELYNRLADEIDTVIHAAANVHHVGDTEAFMNTNYYGTKRMIKFSKAAHATLHFASSYVSSGFSVVPIHSDISVFSEQMLYIGQDYRKNIYAHTKYLSEVEILKEREKGLQANIYRMGCLTSRRSDGVFQVNGDENGLLKRIHGAIKIGMIQDTMKQAPIDFTAVDECADAFVRLIFSGKTNHIYHMFNPNTMTMSEIGHYCEKKIESVSREKFHSEVKKHLEDEEIAALSFYTEMLACSKPLRIDNAETVNDLRQVGFEWGVNTKEYVMQFIG